MIARASMDQNLHELNQLFLNATSSKETLFYSKLAMLELCGWIEESMDDLVLRIAKRSIKSTGNLDHIQQKVVKPTYGFEYEKHFRGMLLKIIGMVNVERLEGAVDQSKQAKLKATLETLKLARNTEAHTHIRGVTKVIDAPSVTISRFADVYDGLLDYDRAIRRMSL